MFGGEGYKLKSRFISDLLPFSVLIKPLHKPPLITRRSLPAEIRGFPPLLNASLHLITCRRREDSVLVNPACCCRDHMKTFSFETLHSLGASP